MLKALAFPDGPKKRSVWEWPFPNRPFFPPCLTVISTGAQVVPTYLTYTSPQLYNTTTLQGHNSTTVRIVITILVTTTTLLIQTTTSLQHYNSTKPQIKTLKLLKYSTVTQYSPCTVSGLLLLLILLNTMKD